MEVRHVCLLVLTLNSTAPAGSDTALVQVSPSPHSSARADSGSQDPSSGNDPTWSRELEGVDVCLFSCFTVHNVLVVMQAPERP